MNDTKSPYHGTGIILFEEARLMEAIKNMPPMERPLEKLQTQGAKSLSDTELLAILLGHDRHYMRIRTYAELSRTVADLFPEAWEDLLLESWPCS